MMRRILLLALALFSAMSASAYAQKRVPVALGTDIGTPLAGVFMGAVSASIMLELPLSGSCAVDIEPSFYAASGTGTQIFQVDVTALARLYFLPLFSADAEKPADRGPFMSAGAVAAFGSARGDWIAADLAIGPTIRAGYRFIFGESGFYTEPALGFTALFGDQIKPSGNSLSVNAGFTFGIVMGWRF